MPELPEVETYIRELAPQLQGRTVTGAQVFWPRTIAWPDPETFRRLIQGRRFVGFGRRGKHLIFHLDDGRSLIVHLRMTGELRVRPGDYVPDKHTHVILELDDGRRLVYRDQRKFGRFWLVEDPAQVVGKLGPEPLSDQFTPEALAQKLAGRKASIKALLLDQSVVAGVGNIYADEALFLAGIHPARPGGSLSPEEIQRLHQAIRTVLEQAIKARGSSLQSYAPPSGQGSFQEQHRVFRRDGQACPRCGAPIQRIKLAQRSTHFCPRCQR